ncbi:hypothetical protein N7457_004377 [Penicillium paradoxum]|uniref:uncharacterized protein n=1 Tax=Penicillium paradoxum TaxID=176176 RepID=UPI002548AE75|nr:uncharacterized protein N7457_004377 [Penicillium paradoxum]KAJ5782603.1 hypothetical protein N7457_004377 [Penicillium paradoxum]
MSRGRSEQPGQSHAAYSGPPSAAVHRMASRFSYMARPCPSISSSGFDSDIVPAPRRQSRPPSTGSSPPNTGPQERHQGPADYLQRSSPHQYNDHHHFSSLAPPLEGFPSAVPVCQSFDPFAQESALWAEPDLSFVDTDWNFISVNHPTSYPPDYDGGDAPILDLGYGDMDVSAFNSLSDSGSIEFPHYVPASMASSSAHSRDDRSHPSPVSQLPAPVSASFSSPTASNGDDVLSRVDSSRVEKRKLNTLAARRCRQRRVDRMKDLEGELEKVRKERDELRLRCSKLEGETDALKGLLTRRNRDT